MQFLKDKKLIVLGLVFVLLLGTYLVLAGSKSKKEEDQIINNQDAISVTDYQEQNIQSFSYKYASLGIDLHFEKQGTGWICTDYPDYPIDSQKIHRILSDIITVSAQRYLEADEYDIEDPAYGFEEPQAEVMLDDGTKRTELTIGGMTGVWYYCKSSLTDKLYAINNDLMLAIDQSILDVVKYTKLPGMNKSSIRGITLEYNGSTYVFTPNVTTATVTGEDGTVSEQETIIWGSTKDGVVTATPTESIELGIEALCNLEQVRCVAYSCSEDDLRDYGFASPYAVFHIDYIDNTGADNSFVLEAGLLDAAGENRFIRINDLMEITSVGSVFDSHILPALIANAGEVVDNQETIEPHTPFADFDT